MKLDRFFERVLANAHGLTNSAYRPLKGVARVQARGVFGRLIATILSFVGLGRKPTTKRQKPDRYPHGFNRSQEQARRVRQADTLQFHRDDRIYD